MRKEWLHIKKPGLEDLGNSQSTQMAKDTKIRLTVRKANSRERVEGMAIQSFANMSKRPEGLSIQPCKSLLEMFKGTTYRFPQSSHKKPNIEIILFKKDSWQSLLPLMTYIRDTLVS